MLYSKSPVPLWVVLVVGVVGILAAYVVGQPRQGEVQSTLLVNRPTSTPVVSTLPQPPVPTLATPSSTVSAAPIPSGWKTYHNTRFGFDISFPADWDAYARGEGEYIHAEGDEWVVSISHEDPKDGISIDIVTLGSSALPLPYRSATSLDAYVQLIVKASTALSPLPQSEPINGLHTFGFNVCWIGTCWVRSYFQKGQQVYQIDKPATVDERTFLDILGTMRFTP